MLFLGALYMKTRFDSKKLYVKDINCEYREFDSITDATQWGDKYYRDWARKYTLFMNDVQHLSSLSAYSKYPVKAFCGYGFLPLNKYLREGIVPNNAFLQSFADILQLAICSAPRIPENIIVYRLVCDKVIEELLTKTNTYTYFERGFLSTSLYEKFYVKGDEHFVAHNNILKIYIRKGASAMFTSAVEPRSECEMLFLPNITLGLIKKPYKKDGKMVYECFCL